MIAFLNPVACRGRLLMLVLALWPVRAVAAEGEVEVIVGPDYGVAPMGSRRLAGYGLGAELSYGWDDEIAVSIGGHSITHPKDQGSSPFDVSFVHGGLRYAIDVLAVTPYVRADAARYLERPRSENATAFNDWSLQGSVGLSWRAWPHTNVGAEVRFHDLAARFSEQPTYVSLWLFASWVVASHARDPDLPDGS